MAYSIMEALFDSRVIPWERRNVMSAERKELEEKVQNKKQEQLNARIDKKENSNRKFLENCAFKMGLDDKQKIEFVYQQRMKYCVWLLKNLGVLA